jgi:hypothetical protein
MSYGIIAPEPLEGGEMQTLAMQRRTVRQVRGEIGATFEPDVMVPEQFAGQNRRQDVRTPEQRLQYGVLENAMDELRMLAGRVRSIRFGTAEAAAEQRSRLQARFDETCAWFADEDDAHPFTFLRICESLGIDASYFRRGLRERDFNPEKIVGSFERTVGKVASGRLPRATGPKWERSA